MPDFSGINPVSAISGGLQTLGGLGQALFSGVKKANNNLENFSKTYVPNQTMNDFYTRAYNNAANNQYNSLQYQKGLDNNAASEATANTAAGNQRAGLGNIGSIQNNNNQSNAANAANAESQNRANIGLLGQAAAAKTREDKVPFDLQYNLLAAKAAAAAKTKSDGLQNIFGGLSNIAGGIKTSPDTTSTTKLLNPLGLMGTYAPRGMVNYNPMGLDSQPELNSPYESPIQFPRLGQNP